VKVPDVARLREEFKGPHELVKTSDGKTIFVRHWEGTRPDLAILIFHGITAYSEPYGKILAEALARAGFNVFGMDLRGHGLSDGTRGDYPGRDRFSKDLCETIAFLKERFARLVLVGHSLGVLSAVAAVNSCGDKMDGLVLLSAARKIRPGAYSRPSAGAAMKVLVGVALFPGSRLIEYRRSGMTGIQDPLYNFHYSARFYATLYGASALSVVRMLGRNQIDSAGIVISRKLGIPLLVGLGDSDEIFSVDSAREFFDGIDADNKTFMVIPGARHAAFPEGSWTPLVEWLRKSFPEKQPS
jgi:acylglycerol lipase